jgi:hypothetical protein
MSNMTFDSYEAVVAFKRKDALAAVADPGATGEQLYLAARWCCKKVLAHPMLPLLMLADPVMHRKILDRIRERRAVRAWEKIVEPLPYPHKKRLIVSMLRHVAPKLAHALFLDNDDDVLRFAHVLEAVTEKQISPGTAMVAMGYGSLPDERREGPDRNPDNNAWFITAIQAVAVAVLAVLYPSNRHPMTHLPRAGQKAHAALLRLLTIGYYSPDARVAFLMTDTEIAGREWIIAEAKKIRARAKRRRRSPAQGGSKLARAEPDQHDVGAPAER